MVHLERVKCCGEEVESLQKIEYNKVKTLMFSIGVQAPCYFPLVSIRMFTLIFD